MSTNPLKSGKFTRRGIRSCQWCGQQNGFRQKGCKNKDCFKYIRKPLTRKQCNIDPVELITYIDTSIYSVLIKERSLTNRNFVEITDTTLSNDDTLGSIISRNAICYIDTCKYDATELLSISCKHVKNASLCTNKAEAIKITKNVLYNMKITDEERQSIWKLYSENELIVPPLQRINKSIFVIQCPKSITYPAGRLHITVTPDDNCIESLDNITSPTAINLNYYCSCKKLKILLKPNENLQSEICEHTLFLLAGFLSSSNLQTEFKKFMVALNFLWIDNVILEEDNFLPTELLVHLSSGMDLNEHNYSINNIFQSDPHLISGYCNDNNTSSKNAIQLVDIPLTTTFDDNDIELELTDCQIELMDQFHSLTNEIDMGNDIIELDANVLLENNNETILNLKEDQNINKSIIVPTNMVTNTKKKSNQKKISNVDKKTIKLKSNTSITQSSEVDNIIPSLEFDNWLAYVIERINSTIDFNSQKSNVLLEFQIQEDFFIHFRNKFSIGLKKRIPNQTEIIKMGKYKGKLKYSYIFTTFTTVNRIFSNDLAEIQFEKQFDEKSNGFFTPLLLDNQKVLVTNSSNKKLKLIRPNTFTAHICLGNKQYDNEKHNKFIVEWIPNIFPSSKFGILFIQFTLGFKRNNLKINIAK